MILQVVTASPTSPVPGDGWGFELVRGQRPFADRSRLKAPAISSYLSPSWLCPWAWDLMRLPLGWHGSCPSELVPPSPARIPENWRCRMAVPNAASAAVTLTITGEERALLLTFLERALRTKQVEEHRTEAFDYKDLVRHEVNLLEDLIEKLRKA